MATKETRYQRRRAQHLCARCGKQDARVLEGKALCVECAAKQKAHYATMQARMKEWQRSQEGGIPDVDTTSCEVVDLVNHPAHYNRGAVECIDAIESAVSGLNGMEGVCTGNVIKYLWRWKDKGGIEDLRKARWYLNRLIMLESM